MWNDPLFNPGLLTSARGPNDVEGAQPRSPIGLTGQQIGRLYASSPTPQAAALRNELYRLRALVRRAAECLAFAKARGMENGLDLTSTNLLRALDRQLQSEPVVIEYSMGLIGCVTPGTAAAPASQIVAARTPSMPPETMRVDSSRFEEESGDRERLFTWKLSPEPGRGIEEWNKAGYRGVVIVRAYDPVQARRLAAEKLSLKSDGAEDLERLAQTSPWGKRSLVRAELVSDDSTYNKITVPSVVYP